MRKNNKELVGLLFRELFGAYSLLEDLTGGDLEELDEIDPSLAYLFMRLDDIISWGDQTFNLLEEATDVDEYECAKDFLKFHIPLCEDCESDSFKWFMVQNEIWDKYGVDDRMLCLECLEKRVGRKMLFEDFTDCPLNNENEYIQSLKETILN